MALNSVTDKLSGSIEYVVTRRQQNWDYLKRAHQGQVHWLNVIQLSKSVIVRSFPPEKLVKRIRRWFMLGLSFGRLLELSEGATLVRALGQLIEEYEHFIDNKKDLPAGGRGLLDPVAGEALPPETFLYIGSAHGSAHAQAVVAVAAQQAQQAAAASAASAQGEAIKPTLRKVGKEVVYDYLQTHATCMPDTLDYCEVVHSLCDVLSLIYSKFLDESCSASSVHEAILRIDRKLKLLVLTKITLDLSTDVAAPAMKREMMGLLNLFGKHLSKEGEHFADEDDDEDK